MERADRRERPVQQALGLDSFAACVYVFSNRRRHRVKVLGGDRNGFWLLLNQLRSYCTLS